MIGAAKLGQPQAQTAKVKRVNAPLQGIDTRLSVLKGGAENCIYTFNLMPAEFGMIVRKGYREWQVAIESTEGTGVNSVIPFNSVKNDVLSDRLFSVTVEGIWNTTNQGEAPVLVQAFTDNSEGAGYGVYTHYVGNAEQDILFFADNVNGLFQYDSTTDSWSRPTGITGPVIEDVYFVVVHKQRLWMIEKESTKAWYLDVGAVSGAATEFFFGTKFRHGGHLVGLFNWTVDGGAGVDDYLVAVSKSGDVLPYQGSDPSATDWTLVGTYFIGEVPKGPKIGSEHGGVLYLLSVYGLISVTGLMKGTETVDVLANSSQIGISAKVAEFLRGQLSNTIDLFGWGVRVLPSIGGLLISSPFEEGKSPIQYYYNIANASWGLWRGLPITSFVTWRENVLIGLNDNRLGYMDVDIDDVKLVDPPEGQNGVAIEWSILSSFHSFDTEGLYKQVVMIRPDFSSDYEPDYRVEARYDYDLREAGLLGTYFFNDPALWDDSLWDIGLWGPDINTTYNDVKGTWGTGRYIALSMRGKSASETKFIGWDVIYKTGGPLI